MTTDFFDALHAATPRIRATYCIIAVNLLVFLLTTLGGVHPLSPNSGQLLAVGGNYLPITVEQPWRLVSSTILHAGALHLAMNMWVLFAMGKVAERLYGSLQFAIIYLLAGFFGSLTSLFFTAQTAVSVGASGAIYGIAGAIIAAVLTQSGKLPGAVVQHLRVPILFFVLVSMAFGLFTDWIDNSSHIGGLLSGFLLAAMMVARFDWDLFRTHGARRALLAIAVAFGVAVAMWQLVPLPAI